MSGKTVQLRWDAKSGEFWLSWGNETFYDEHRYLRSWVEAADAKQWLQANHPELELIDGMVISANSADKPEQLEQIKGRHRQRPQERPGAAQVENRQDGPDKPSSAQPGPAGWQQLAFDGLLVAGQQLQLKL